MVTAAVLAPGPVHMQEGAEHSHSSSVTSVGIEAEGELCFPKVQAWLGNLLRVRHGMARSD